MYKIFIHCFYIYIKYILWGFFFIKEKFNKNFKTTKNGLFVKQINPFNKFFSDKNKFKIKKFTSKEDKQYYDLMKKQEESEILSTYWKYLQVFYYSYTHIVLIRFIRIVLFVILFVTRFFIFKFWKNIVNIWIITKTMHFFVYYILNIYLYLKIIMRHIYLKYIWYFYFKAKINIIYYLNMFIHYKFFKFITHLFLQESYYLNTEMIDKFPYYSSKYVTNFFLWFYVIINQDKIKLYRLNIIFNLYSFIFSKIIKFFIIFIPFSIKSIYYVLLFQMKIYNMTLKNKTIIIKLIVFFFIIILFYKTINLFFIISVVCCYNIYYIISKTNINKIYNIIWYLGFYLFFLYDILLFSSKKLIIFIIKITKYLVFYPFIIYLIIFFLINNPIIYIKFTYILKLFILPLLKLIYYIINDFNNILTISIFFSYEHIISYIENDTFIAYILLKNDYLMQIIYLEKFETVLMIGEYIKRHIILFSFIIHHLIIYDLKVYTHLRK